MELYSHDEFIHHTEFQVDLAMYIKDVEDNGYCNTKCCTLVRKSLHTKVCYTTQGAMGT